MIESMFILMFAIGFILFLYCLDRADEPHAWFLNVILTVWWLIIMANSFYIEIPGVESTFSDAGVNALCLLFVLFGVVQSISQMMNRKKVGGR
jgi:hypothetical protein